MRRLVRALLPGALALLLTGCVFTAPETSLYRLPRLSGEYESLESKIDALLDGGAEYAAPAGNRFCFARNYSCGPAATRALPASLPSYLTKFLMKREARSFALTSHSAASL